MLAGKGSLFKKYACHEVGPLVEETITLTLQFPSGALWSVLGQDSLFHIASVYPAANWVPSIKKAVLRACVLYAASCSGISLGD